MARDKDQVDAAKQAAQHAQYLAELERKIDQQLDSKGRASVAMYARLTDSELDSFRAKYPGYTVRIMEARTPQLIVE